MRLKRHHLTSLPVIITAALLLEVISAVQYIWAHNMLEAELEAIVLDELTIKALRVTTILRSAETTIKNHVWYAERHLPEPDTMMVITERIVTLDESIAGAYVALKPGYYPRRGRLYEPYSRRQGDSIVTEQIASEAHDYTQRDFYQKCMNADTVRWTNPYYDGEGAKNVVISYVQPLREPSGEVVGAIGIDLPIDWMGSTLNRRHMSPSSFDLLLSRDGKLIAGPDSNAVSAAKVEQVLTLINDSSVQRELTDSKRSTCISFTDIDGEDAYIYYANMKGAPRWQVAIVCYDDEVYGGLYRLRLGIAGLSLMGLLLLAFILWRMVLNSQRLQRSDMERQRIESELRIARNIQKDMLPVTGTAYADRNDVTVCGSLVPAKEVGGDLFDHFIRDEKLYFCIGDVSGKGVPSAMVMAVIHSLFRTTSAHESNPGRIMNAINEVSCQNNESNVFVTLFIGVLDLPTGRLHYCNAGHDHPIIVGRGDLEANANLPVGLFTYYYYDRQETVLDDDTMLFLYTDGLTEMRNHARKFFGKERVMQVLDDCRGLSAEALLQRVSAAANSFRGEAEQSDDLTMMAVHYVRQKDESVFADELTLKNDVRQVARLSEFMKTLAARLGMPTSDARNLRLAVEEVVVNVMDYAYPVGIEGDIVVKVSYDGHRLKIIIADSGTPFDPTETARADTTLSAEDRPIGGLGILLVREMVDSINYERADGQNVLTILKNYQQQKE